MMRYLWAASTAFLLSAIPLGAAYAQMSNYQVTTACPATNIYASFIGQFRSGLIDVNGGICMSGSGSSTLPPNASTAGNQTAVQSAPGTPAGTAEGLQGVTGGVPVTVGQTDGISQTLAGSAVGPLTNATYPTGAIPTAGFASVSVQLTSPGTGNNFVFEVSDDGINWSADTTGQAANNSGSFATTSGPGVGSLVRWALKDAFFHVRISTYGSGTVTAVVTMKVANVAPIANYVTPSVGTAQATPLFASESAANLATSQASAPISTGSAQIVCAARTGRRAATIQQLGAVQVWVGASGVTASTGVALPGTVGSSVTIPSSAAVYGISSGAAQNVACLETF